MLNRLNLKGKFIILLDVVSIIYIFIIIAIIITGGYKGSVLGVRIIVSVLKDPVIILVFSIVLRYIISKDSPAATWPVKILVRIKSYIARKPLRTLFIIISLYLIYFKLCQHFIYDTYACDLSVFDYPLHYTLQGKFMYFPWWSSSIKNFLGMHFWPILIAIVPFYYIYDSPITLLILQGIFTSLALIPLLKIAKENGFDKEDCICLGVFYIFNIYTWRAFEYNFHIEILYPVFIFSAFYTAYKKKYLLHTLFIILTLTIKEDAFFHCIMLEMYFLIFFKNRKIAIFNIAIALVWGGVTLMIILPYLQKVEMANIFLIDRYGHLGSNYSEIILYIITHPLQMCKMVFRPSFFRFLFSFSFLPLLHYKLSLFGFPSIIIHLITNFSAQYDLKFYHALPAIPFFVISTILALNKIDVKWRKRLLLLIMIISLSSFRTPGLLFPTSADFKAHSVFTDFNTDEVISAQANIIPHLPRYSSILIYPDRTQGTGYIMLKLTGLNGIKNKTRVEYYQEILDIIENEGFIAKEYLFPYVILKREEDKSETDKKTIKLREDLLRLLKER